MKRAGFTLLEVLVALVVLEVGLLGVVGTLWLAARTLTAAEVLEQGVQVMEGIYDSLALVTAPTDGVRRLPSGEVRWRVMGREGRMVLLAPAGDTLARVDVPLRVSGSSPR